MKTKQIWTLLVILAVLAAGAFLRHKQKPAQLSTEDSVSLNLSFDENQIEKVVLSRSWEEDLKLPAQKIELEKRGQDWILPGLSDAPVNSQKIKEFFRQIREAQGETRAQGKEFFKDFEIADFGSVRVSLHSANGKPELEFFLGLKTAAETTFLRKRDSDIIYVTRTNFFSQIGIYNDPAKENLSPSSWAALDFLKLDADKVRQIEIKTLNEKGRESVKTSLELKGGKWAYKNPSAKQAVSEATVKDFMAGMSTWTAEKVLPEGTRDFSKPFWQMTVHFEGGDTKVFKAGERDKETEAVFLQVSGEGPVYQLSKYYFDNLDKDDSYFQEASVPADSPKK